MALPQLSLHVLFVMHPDDLSFSAFFLEGQVVLFLFDLLQDIIHDEMLLQSFGVMYPVVSPEQVAILVYFHFTVL